MRFPKKIIQIIAILIGILIILPLIYLAYDRSLMPPAPTWTSPSYIPGESWEQYATKFLKTSKKPNALEHYLKAYSLVNQKSIESVWHSFDTILKSGWKRDYPDVEKVLQINQLATQEMIKGVALERCEFPPEPYTLSAPIPDFGKTNCLGMLFTITGIKREYQRQPREAMQCYLDCIQFTHDMGQKGLNGLGIRGIRDNMKFLKRLVQSEKLAASDYVKIIRDLHRVEQEQVSFGDIVEQDYRIHYSYLYTRTKHPIIFARLTKMRAEELRNIIPNPRVPSYQYLSLYIFFSRGRILSNDYGFYNDLLNIVTTRTYREFRQTDWLAKEPQDLVHGLIFGCSFLHYGDRYSYLTQEVISLRLTQIQAAVQLYRLKKKQWPKEINDLRPYAPSILLDPYTDKPFLWAKDKNNRPFAYSIGPDREDNAAKIVYDPSNGTSSNGDIF